MRSFFVLALLGAVLVTIALVVRSGMLARRNPGQPISRAMREALAAESPQLSTEDEALISERYPTAHRTPSGLRYVVRAPGDGDGVPRVGSQVTAHYDGRLLNGSKFDSSYERGQPFTFQVGVGAVIKAWDEAFLGMHRGEKRTLIVPYWLGYGTTGTRGIPPRATLVFEVELIAFTP